MRQQRAVLGARRKVQNNALVYQAARVEDEVFIGPAVVFTHGLQPPCRDAGGQARDRRRPRTGHDGASHTQKKMTRQRPGQAENPH